MGYCASDPIASSPSTAKLKAVAGASTVLRYRGNEHASFAGMPRSRRRHHTGKTEEYAVPQCRHRHHTVITEEDVAVVGIAMCVVSIVSTCTVKLQGVF